jgi:hypothetical protein
VRSQITSLVNSCIAAGCFGSLFTIIVRFDAYATAYLMSLANVYTTTDPSERLWYYFFPLVLILTALSLMFTDRLRRVVALALLVLGCGTLLLAPPVFWYGLLVTASAARVLLWFVPAYAAFVRRLTDRPQGEN